MKLIDNLLDRITMYRLVLYYLIVLLAIATIFGFFGILTINPISIILTSLVFVSVCYAANKIFAKAYRAPANVESVYITALILALIVSPMKSVADFPLVFFAGLLAIASKYILAINKKHIFNPAAIAVVLTALGFSGSASWWIGTAVMLPFSLLGLLIVRKIRRFDLVFYFFIAAVVSIFGFSVMQGSNLVTTFKDTLLYSPIFFFAFIMLTEPLTSPPTKGLQAAYGALVGVLFAPQFHILSLYTTPEQALVIGNVFSYIVSPKYKIIATVGQKLQRGQDMIDFIFPLQKKLAYLPGQYMEWTLSHKNTDSRGNRRYFTVASSPTENHLMLGIKFYPKGSSYKKAMAALDAKTPIVGAHPAGDFTLPKNKNQKVVFIAGGIGITPFRSMIKYLIDTKQARQIVLLYSNKTIDEIAYSDIFTQALPLGVRTVYTLTDAAKVPSNWQGERGRIDANMIAREVPDFKERIFYLSGPHAMVTAYKETLKKMGIPQNKIKIDFFPGFV